MQRKGLIPLLIVLVLVSGYPWPSKTESLPHKIGTPALNTSINGK